MAIVIVVNLMITGSVRHVRESWRIEGAQKRSDCQLTWLPSRVSAFGSDALLTCLAPGPSVDRFLFTSMIDPPAFYRAFLTRNCAS